jgi:hypothetical protein
LRVKYTLIYNNTEAGLFFSDAAKTELKKNGLKNLEEIYSTEIETMKNDIELCDHLYQITNSGQPNPLTSPTIQEKIRKSKAHHTSMSVGDVIAIERDGRIKHYVCDELGWSDAELQHSLGVIQ